MHRFIDYNFREYTLRRAREGFRQHRSSSGDQAQQAYNSGVEQYRVLERQVLINSLYSKGDFVIEKVSISCRQCARH